MKKNFDFGNRGWEKGDLVQIDVGGSPLGARNDGLGVVIVHAHESDRQGNLFPAFYVYNLKLGQAKKYYSYDLELISPINP